jgi:glycosyltransferase involved in cell wall biosynthesis
MTLQAKLDNHTAKVGVIGLGYVGLPLMRAFWSEFSRAIEQTRDLKITDVINALDEDLGAHFFPPREDGTDPRQCPSCQAGRLGLKLGRHGSFIGCSNYPGCQYTRRLAVEGGDEAGDTLKEGMRVLGWRGDVAQVHAAADLVVLTSDNEGMPVTLIEGAAAGCACVTTDVGSAGEVVLDGRTGSVVPCDARAVADAVTALLDDPDLRLRFGAAARAHASEHFGMTALADRLEQVYRSGPAATRR